MIILGITGGMGSGKSTISEIFRLLDIPVYIADTESKRLTDTSKIIRQKLISLFGNEIYDGAHLNKSLLASHIFSDNLKLQQVNAIIHPVVYTDFEEWIQKHTIYPILATESAILFEAGMDKYTDKNIIVYTPLEERVKRIMKRDGLSRDKIIDRINNQLPDEEKLKRADYIINNDESESLINQCMTIIREFQ